MCIVRSQRDDQDEEGQDLPRRGGGHSAEGGQKRRAKGAAMKAILEVGEREATRSPEIREQAASALEMQRRLITLAPVRPLFSDCLLGYEGQKGRQTWTTLFSFTLQCLVIGVLILLPLYFTQELPKSQLLTFLVAPPPPPPPPPPAQAANRIREEEAPPPMGGGGVVGGVPGGIPGGKLGGVIGGIVSAISNLNVVPKLQPVIPQRIRISQGVTSGMLIRKIEPAYPPLAKVARVQGEVVLRAIIDREGNIQ